MTRQPAWDDDLLRRALIERAPPLTWRGIGAYAVVSAVGLILGLVSLDGPWGLIALGLFIVGVLQALRGVLRMAWLGLGGTDRPLRAYLKRRLDE